MRCSIEKLLVGLVMASLLMMAIGCSANYDSPDAVFSTATKALKDRDIETFCHCLTPKSQEKMAGALAMGGMMMKAFGEMAAGFQMADQSGGPKSDEAKAKMEEMKEKMEKIDDILEKHGLTEDALKEMPDLGNGEEAIAKVTVPIKDKVAFIVDMFEVFEDLSQDKSGPEDILGATLTDVEVSGDTATGTMTRTGKGRERTEKIEFSKIDGSWLIELPQGLSGSAAETNLGPNETEFPEIPDPTPIEK